MFVVRRTEVWTGVDAVETLALRSNYVFLSGEFYDFAFKRSFLDRLIQMKQDCVMSWRAGWFNQK